MEEWKRTSPYLSFFVIVVVVDVQKRRVIFSSFVLQTVVEEKLRAFLLSSCSVLIIDARSHGLPTLFLLYDSLLGRPHGIISFYYQDGHTASYPCYCQDGHTASYPFYLLLGWPYGIDPFIFIFIFKLGRPHGIDPFVCYQDGRPAPYPFVQEC